MGWNIREGISPVVIWYMLDSSSTIVIGKSGSSMRTDAIKGDALSFGKPIITTDAFIFFKKLAVRIAGLSLK